MRLYMGRVWPLWELGLWASEQVPLSIWLFSLVTMWLLTTSSGSGFPHISVNPHHRGCGVGGETCYKYRFSGLPAVLQQSRPGTLEPVFLYALHETWVAHEDTGSCGLEPLPPSTPGDTVSLLQP